MNRQSRTSWIYRYSRPLIAGIATVGAVITAYLTTVKLAGSSLACPVSGCDRVLSSPYATVFGLPLALFGFLAYISMVVLAVAPWLIQSENKKKLRSLLEGWSWQLIFIGAIAMTIFSNYLMYLMAFEIKSLCFYCLASAIFSFSLFVLTLIGRTWEDIGQPFFIATIVGILTLIGTLAIYPPIKPPITLTQSTSGAAEIALVQHLNQLEAKMYGAFTCRHCQNQKQLFGREAASQLNYIECHPKGKNARPDLCQAANIQGFPTWEINGKFYQGVKSLDKLADLSGYQGKRNFVYTPT